MTVKITINCDCDIQQNKHFTYVCQKKTDILTFEICKIHLHKNGETAPGAEFFDLYCLSYAHDAKKYKSFPSRTNFEERSLSYEEITYYDVEEGRQFYFTMPIQKKFCCVDLNVIYTSIKIFKPHITNHSILKDTCNQILDHTLTINVKVDIPKTSSPTECLVKFTIAHSSASNVKVIMTDPNGKNYHLYSNQRGNVNNVCKHKDKCNVTKYLQVNPHLKKINGNYVFSFTDTAVKITGLSLGFISYET